jgi:hypothetical protein
MEELGLVLVAPQRLGQDLGALRVPGHELHAEAAVEEGHGLPDERVAGVGIGAVLGRERVEHRWRQVGGHRPRTPAEHDTRMNRPWPDDADRRF